MCLHSRVQIQVVRDLKEEEVSQDSHMSSGKFPVFYHYFTRQTKNLTALNNVRVEYQRTLQRN
jgi:hypothetical protein